MGHATSSGRTTPLLKPNEYRYHGTSYNALQSIARNGLRPSTRGHNGAGVYFTYSENQATDWALETQGNVRTAVLRVRGDHLNSYGYEDYDDEEGLSRKTIKPEHIEVQVLRNGAWRWIPLRTWARSSR